MKPSYQIRASLNRSFLDHEITLSGGGFNSPPIAMRSILFWLVSGMILLWLMTSTTIGDSAWYLQVMFVITWIVASIFFGKGSGTKELNLFMVPAVVEYLPKANRRVATRTASKPAPFYSIARLDDIDETGFIRFSDGTVGQLYLVVGSASVLLFDEDEAAMLRRVDGFWQKVDTEVEYAFITTKEPQRVEKQMAHLGRLNQNLEHRHHELFDLMEERHQLLKDYVGTQFTSIHQYLLLKANNVEALRKAHTGLVTEQLESSLMIKEITMLNREDALSVLKTLYQSTARV